MGSPRSLATIRARLQRASAVSGSDSRATCSLSAKPSARCHRRPDRTERSGSPKGGSYEHFDDRRALLEAMLDTWERVVIDEAIERVEGEGGDARAKPRRL